MTHCYYNEGNKGYSYLEVKQRMGDEIGTGSETERDRRCLGGKYLSGKIFSVRRFIIAFFFAKRRCVTFLSCALEFPACFFLFSFFFFFFFRRSEVPWPLKNYSQEPFIE